MEVGEYPIKGIPKSGVVKLVFFACTHFGSRGIAIDQLQDDIFKVKDDPWARWLHLGDAGEFISVNDKRFQMGELDPRYNCDAPIDLQVDDTIRTFSRIRKQGVGFIMGNHEDSYLCKNQSNPGRRITKGLGIDLLGFTTLIRLRLKLRTGQEWCPVVYAMHGKTGATTPQGQMGYLKRIAAPFTCDVAAMAHVHRKGIDNNEIFLGLNDAGDDVKEHSRHYLISGTYAKTYFVRGDGNTGYAEKKHYAPSALGAVCAEFYVADRVIRAVDHW